MTKSKPYNPVIVYDQDLKRWDVPSKTHDGHKYAVRANVTGNGFTCTCVWGRGMQKSTGRTCIHIKKVEQWLKEKEASQRVKYLQ